MRSRAAILRRPVPLRLYDKPGFDGEERNIGVRQRCSDYDSLLRFEILRRHVRQLNGVVPRFSEYAQHGLLGWLFRPITGTFIEAEVHVS